jgi:hypothetical protein
MRHLTAARRAQPACRPTHFIDRPETTDRIPGARYDCPNGPPQLRRARGPTTPNEHLLKAEGLDGNLDFYQVLQANDSS